MKAGKEFDLIEFIQALEKEKIPYLLIGRWAVILHGAPLMTADYDFWISPSDRRRILHLLERMRYDLPPATAWKQPLLTVYCASEKIDLLFFKQITNREGQRLSFEQCSKRSDVKEDRRRRISVRIPSIDDLIALKKSTRSTPEDELKDATDIRFLEAIKRGKHE